MLNELDGPVAFSVLLKDLLERGARLRVPEKPNRYAANLKTAIVNNPAKFQFNKTTETVSLAKRGKPPAA